MGAADEEIQEIPIINVKNQTLSKVIEFLHAYKNDKMDEITRVSHTDKNIIIFIR